jgi:hypothetical protein
VGVWVGGRVGVWFVCVCTHTHTYGLCVCVCKHIHMRFQRTSLRTDKLNPKGPAHWIRKQLLHHHLSSSHHPLRQRGQQTTRSRTHLRLPRGEEAPWPPKRTPARFIYKYISLYITEYRLCIYISYAKVMVHCYFIMWYIWIKPPFLVYLKTS